MVDSLFIDVYGLQKWREKAGESLERGEGAIFPN